MRRKSNYMIDFEFIEQEMFGVVVKFEESVNMMDFKTNFQNAEYSLLGYSKRASWLRKIIVALEEIHNDVNSRTKEIILMLYKEGKSIKNVSDELNIKYKRLVRQHALIVDEVMECLGVFSEKKTKHKASNRHIPTHVKIKVFDRDEGCCTVCKSEEKLHYHHIQRFSDGGTHSVHNLKLLCNYCHAEEHKGESEYNLLKSNV